MWWFEAGCVCVSKEGRGTVSGSFWRSSTQQSCDSIKIRVAHPRVALTKGISGVRTRVTLTPSLWGTNAITCFTDATTAQRGWGTYPRSWGWQVVKVGFKPRKSVSTVFIFLPTTSSSKSQLYPRTPLLPLKVFYTESLICLQEISSLSAQGTIHLEGSL